LPRRPDATEGGKHKDCHVYYIYWEILSKGIINIWLLYFRGAPISAAGRRRAPKRAA
jgi:hypothetical protein